MTDMANSMYSSPTEDFWSSFDILFGNTIAENRKQGETDKLIIYKVHFVYYIIMHNT